MTSFSNISPQDLHALQKQGRQIELLDVRSPAEYRDGHALGAKLLPLDGLSPETLAKQVQEPGAGQHTPLYITCRSGFRAQQAAERLRDAGYHNLVLVEGGTDAWEKAGLPLRRIGNVISLERQVQITIGTLLVLKVFLGFTVHELFFALGALIGAGLITAGITRWCGMARLIGLLPWNRKQSWSEQATV